MKDKVGNKGFTLVEVIVAMAILAMGIVSMLTLYNVMITGNIKSDELLNQSITVNELVDEIKGQVHKNKVTSKEESILLIEKIVLKYPNYHFILEVVPNIKNLYEIKLIYTGYLKHEHYFYAKFYGGYYE
ncbi:MAG: prepilin-type N-terminal cleavage/methylation domain-containing protein [Eubacterium sp.]